jgi:hypothetical protein
MEANTNLKDQYKTIEILKDKITSVMQTIQNKQHALIQNKQHALIQNKQHALIQNKQHALIQTMI